MEISNIFNKSSKPNVFSLFHSHVFELFFRIDPFPCIQKPKKEDTLESLQRLPNLDLQRSKQLVVQMDL